MYIVMYSIRRPLPGSILSLHRSFPSQAPIDTLMPVRGARNTTGEVRRVAGSRVTTIDVDIIVVLMRAYQVRRIERVGPAVSVDVPVVGLDVAAGQVDRVAGR